MELNPEQETTPPSEVQPVRLGGRRAEATRNDQRILDAARTVFVADPGAPVSAVAKRAGVGMAALYRRYPSKEDLLRKLCLDGLHHYIATAEAALADEGDPWDAFASFMRNVVEAGTHAMVLRLAGTFTPTEELYRLGEQAQELNERLVGRAHAAGVLRADVAVDDIGMLFEQLAAIRLGDEARTRQLRQRYLGLVLDGLHTPAPASLPGPPPQWHELRDRWEP